MPNDLHIIAEIKYEMADIQMPCSLLSPLEKNAPHQCGDEECSLSATVGVYIHKWTYPLEMCLRLRKGSHDKLIVNNGCVGIYHAMPYIDSYFNKKWPL